MSKLHTVVCHDADCSCYQVIIDEHGMTHDCEICDCGELRRIIRKPPMRYSQYHLDVLNECWNKHLAAITKI